jgi:putative phosphoribosyl transferase
VVDGSPPQTVVDEDLCTRAGIDPGYVASQVPDQIREISRRRRVYLSDRAPVNVEGATVILVDDGIATGTSIRAALKALRQRHPSRLVLAIPVAPEDTLRALRPEVDEIVCLERPYPFGSIGQHYIDFHQVSDDEVTETLHMAAQAQRDTPPPGPSSNA